MAKAKKPKITAKQENGDDGYCYVVRINGVKFVEGLTRREVPYYKKLALESWQAKQEQIVNEGTDDWDLIVKLFHWSYEILDIPKSEVNVLYEACWRLTDAYGPLGFIPPGEGYNWSGFRDSTEDAKRNIAAYIRKWMQTRKIDSLKVKKVEM
jgi:hypothetical protein